MSGQGHGTAVRAVGMPHFRVIVPSSGGAMQRQYEQAMTYIRQGQGKQNQLIRRNEVFRQLDHHLPLAVRQYEYDSAYPENFPGTKALFDKFALAFHDIRWKVEEGTKYLDSLAPSYRPITYGEYQILYPNPSVESTETHSSIPVSDQPTSEAATHVSDPPSFNPSAMTDASSSAPDHPIGVPPTSVSLSSGVHPRPPLLPPSLNSSYTGLT